MAAEVDRIARVKKSINRLKETVNSKSYANIMAADGADILEYIEKNTTMEKTSFLKEELIKRKIFTFEKNVPVYELRAKTINGNSDERMQIVITKPLLDMISDLHPDKIISCRGRTIDYSDRLISVGRHIRLGVPKYEYVPKYDGSRLTNTLIPRYIQIESKVDDKMGFLEIELDQEAFLGRAPFVYTGRRYTIEYKPGTSLELVSYTEDDDYSFNILDFERADFLDDDDCRVIEPPIVDLLWKGGEWPGKYPTKIEFDGVKYNLVYTKSSVSYKNPNETEQGFIFQRKRVRALDLPGRTHLWKALWRDSGFYVTDLTPNGFYIQDEEIRQKRDRNSTTPQMFPPLKKFRPAFIQRNELPPMMNFKHQYGVPTGSITPADDDNAFWYVDDKHSPLLYYAEHASNVLFNRIAVIRFSDFVPSQTGTVMPTISTHTSPKWVWKRPIKLVITVVNARGYHSVKHSFKGDNEVVLMPGVCVRNSVTQADGVTVVKCTYTTPFHIAIGSTSGRRIIGLGLTRPQAVAAMHKGLGEEKLELLRMDLVAPPPGALWPSNQAIAINGPINQPAAT